MPSFLEDHILSFLTFLPVVGALILMIMRRPDDVPEPKNINRSGPDAPAPADGKRTAIVNVAKIVTVLKFSAGNRAYGDVP